MANGQVGSVLGRDVQILDLQVRRDRAAQARQGWSQHLHQSRELVEAVAPCSSECGVGQDFSSMLDKEMGR